MLKTETAMQTMQARMQTTQTKTTIPTRIQTQIRILIQTITTTKSEKRPQSEVSFHVIGNKLFVDKSILKHLIYKKMLKEEIHGKI